MSEPHVVELYPVTGEVRIIALTLEQERGNLWIAKVQVEHRLKGGRKRDLLKRVAHFRIRADRPIISMGQVEELLAQAVLQRRLPGID